MSMTHKCLAVSLAGLASVAAAPSVSPASIAPDDAEVRLVVDLSDRELYVMDGEEVERTYRVAVGKPEHPTPTGDFRIRRVVWNPRWVPPDAGWARGKKARGPGDPRNPMGRVKIFFEEPDYYIHGTHEEDSLGRAESHGCVRMRNSEAVDLAKIVMDNGGERREPGWFRRVMNRVTRTQEVHLSGPVRLTVRE